jgi:MMP 1-O-methyltransferase
VAVRAKGFMPEPEGAALYQAGLVAARSGLGPLLEVGTYCAKSAVYLGAAARDAGGRLFSIDHHRGSEELQAGWAHHDPEVVDPATGLIDTLPFARRALYEAGLEDHVVLMVGDSARVAQWWAAQLALVFIDGGHGEAVARSDFVSWVPKVAPGGLLAVHDVFADPAEGGQVPYLLYREVLASAQWEELAPTGSLRVLRRRGAALAAPSSPEGSPGPGLGSSLAIDKV